jgi:hypothetical protein
MLAAWKELASGQQQCFHRPHGMWVNKRERAGVANGDRRFSDVGKIPAALAAKGKELIWNAGTLEQASSHYQKWEDAGGVSARNQTVKHTMTLRS